MRRLMCTDASTAMSLIEAWQNSVPPPRRICSPDERSDIRGPPRWLSRMSLRSSGLLNVVDRGADQLDAVVARPFGGARHIADLAAMRADDQRGRHAERLAGLFERLEHLRAVVSVIGQVADADLFEEVARLLRIAGVDVDGDDLKFVAAELGLERIERRHFLAAGHAPGGPQVEQHGAAAPVVERLHLAGVILEGEIGHAEPRMRHCERRDFAGGERRDPRRSGDRLPAGGSVRIASQMRYPVYRHENGQNRNRGRDADAAAVRGTARLFGLLFLLTHRRLTDFLEPRADARPWPTKCGADASAKSPIR